MRAALPSLVLLTVLRHEHHHTDVRAESSQQNRALPRVGGVGSPLPLLLPTEPGTHGPNSSDLFPSPPVKA